jgi:hypothetical protein
LAVQFTSIKEAGFNRKATRGFHRVVAFSFGVDLVLERLYSRQVDDQLLCLKKIFSPAGLEFRS